MQRKPTDKYLVKGSQKKPSQAKSRPNSATKNVKKTNRPPQQNNTIKKTKVRNSRKSIINSAAVKKSGKKGSASKDKREKNNFKNALSKIEYSFTDLCPFLSRLDNGYTGYKMKDEIYMNVFQIFNTDYVNMSEKDVLLQIEAWKNLYKSIENSELKFLGLNLPTDTMRNKMRIKNVLSRTTNTEYKRILKEMIDELNMLESRQTKQNYMFVYSTNLENLERCNRRVQAILFPLGIAEEVSPKMKEYIFQKLNNPYSV